MIEVTEQLRKDLSAIADLMDKGIAESLPIKQFYISYQAAGVCTCAWGSALLGTGIVTEENALVVSAHAISTISAAIDSDEWDKYLYENMDGFPLPLPQLVTGMNDFTPLDRSFIANYVRHIPDHPEAISINPNPL